MAFWGSVSFQNILSVTNSQLESLHDLAMVWLFVILMVVMVISSAIFLSPKSELAPGSVVLEQTWTLIPMVILITIAYPSLHLLCLQDSIFLTPFSNIKIISNQWNWQSEYLDVQDHVLDMEKLDELAAFEAPVALPAFKTIRVLLTSSDVLHSLGLPSLGVKLDSSPGRLNSTVFSTNSFNLLLGSCYELCGSGHSAMPIFFTIL